MICTQCQAILPPHYRTCPSCGGEEIEKERKAPQVIEKEEVEEITPYAVDGDIDDFGGM